MAAVEDVDITLENLLNLALGSPDIGAVNFNFLHEVIDEILKHLGISKKLARVTNDLSLTNDYYYQQPQTIAQTHASNKEKKAPELENSTKEVSPPQTTQQNAPPENIPKDPNVKTEDTAGANVKTEEGNTTSEIASKEKTSKEHVIVHDTDVTDAPIASNNPKSDNKVTVNSSSKHAKENEQPIATSSNQSRTQSQVPTAATVTKQQSRRQSIIAAQRSSYITKRISSIKGHNESVMNDAAILSRTIERRDSKTPASDMWHVLNINRRVEAAEAAIQGMTNLLDNINSDLDELKSGSTTSAPPLPTQATYAISHDICTGKNQGLYGHAVSRLRTPVTVKSNKNESRSSVTSISKQEQDIVMKMAAKLKTYDAKFVDVDGKVAKMVVKDEIKDFCSKEQVKSLIKDNLDNFEPSFPIMESQPVSSPADNVKENNDASSSDKDSGVDENATATLQQQPKEGESTKSDFKSKSTIAQKVVESVKPTDVKPNEDKEESATNRPASNASIMLKRRDSRESRTRIAYQEVSAKMLYLEQEILKAKDHIAKLESQLSEKIELSAIEGKLDTKEFNEHCAELNKQIKEAIENIISLEKSHHTVSEEVGSLVTQNDEFTEQQNKLSKAFQKLERNLEDMADTFHRSQSDLIRKKSIQASAGIDEAAVNKIRSTIFDVQEQQSKLQNQLDVLFQDTKNKEKAFEGVVTEIQDLKVTKVGQDYVQKELSSKVDRSALNNKIEREQFDACISEIDRNIQNVLQRIEGNEAFTNQSIDTLEICIKDKMGRDEVKQIHSYIDTRFKTFKPKIQETRLSEDNAAATRKKLMKNCNCISCDRPVDLPIGDEVVTLPYYQALPGVKSMRPINTFDLQTLRQHMRQTFIHGNNKQRFELAQENSRLQKELLQLCGIRDLDELAAATNRACGGGHTLIEQHRRNPTRSSISYREDNAPCRQNERQMMETDVRGRDGHIYKGRLQSPTTLPNIRKDMAGFNSSQGVDKTISQPPPRSGSPILHHPSVDQHQMPKMESIGTD